MVDFFIPIDLARECWNGGEECTKTAVLMEGTGIVFKPLKAVKKSRKATRVSKKAKKPNCCFVAGTQVPTEDGYKNIEDVDLGEKLWAKDVETGEEAWKPVTKVWVEPNPWYL